MLLSIAAYLLGCFLSILAHLAHLAQSFYLILDVMIKKKCFGTCLKMQLQERR